MGRIIGKDEFKASLRFAAAEAEADKSVEEAAPQETKPARKKPGPKPGTKKTRTKTEGIDIETVSNAMAKAAKQEEAIKAATKLMTTFTDWLLEEAKDRIETADRWADYTKTLEEML